MSLIADVVDQSRSDFFNDDQLRVFEVGLVVRFEARPLTGQRASARLLQQMDNQLHRMLEGVYTEVPQDTPLEKEEEDDDVPDLPIRVRPDDRIGVTLDVPGSERGRFFRMSKVSNDPVAQLFDLIKTILQSDRSLIFGTWTFVFQIIRIPMGGGGSRRIMWNDAQVFQKTSCVRVRDDDGLCLWRSLVVCRAYDTMRCRIKASPVDEARHRKLYRRVARYNSSLQTKEAQQLRAATQTSSGSYDELTTLAGYLRANITVINRHVPRMVEYRTADTDPQGGYDRTYYILKHQQGNHYDAINSITGFFGCSYYCDACNVRFNTRVAHRCPQLNQCWLCHRLPEEHVDYRVPPIVCDRCTRRFDDEGCYTLHLDGVCKRWWWCVQCNGNYPWSRARYEHVCGERHCRICDRWFKPPHRCFIQPKPARAVLSDMSIRYFDFESDPHALDTHVPNYAVVSSDGVSFTTYQNHGESIMDQFCEGEFCPKHRGYTFVAHNAKGYDAQFIKASLSKRGVVFEYTPNGNKIMELRIPALKIRVIDSANFIPKSLASFPSMFGLDGVRKGTYPYEFNRLAHWSYRGPLPPLQQFLPGGSHGVPYIPGEESTVYPLGSDKDDEMALRQERQRIIRWYREREQTNPIWDNFLELDAYCRNDVRILAQGCEQFRRHFLELTTTERWGEDSRGVDPFAYPTIASACMAALKHKFLDEDCLAYFPQYAEPAHQQAMLWVAYLRYELKDPIVTEDDDGVPLRVLGYRVTAQNQRTGTLYEFNDCFAQGCRACFPKRQQQFQRHQEKMHFLRDREMDVEEMWLCQFRTVKYTHQQYASFELYNTIPWDQRLNARDAFFGGRTNATRLYTRCGPGEQIRYVDFTSLYPFINKYGEYPIGHPEIITDARLDHLREGRYYGVAKCRVLPPTALWHPVLPYRSRGKLTFPLCGACAHAQSPVCRHTDVERAFEGTWCTPELMVAQQCGYQLLAVREVHHFPKKRRGLFEDYVNCFLQGKQEASGWPQVRVGSSSGAESAW